jgi:mono/diheme cytochrome c family protein
MNNKIFSGLFAAALALVSFEACSPAHGNSPGHEYMPDMAHSVAYEASTTDEYSLHTWNDKSVRTVQQLWGTPRLPIKGTIPRGAVGLAAHAGDADYEAILHGGGRGISTPVNGNVPYYYADSDDERIRATKEIVMNPFPITKSGLAKGKALWLTYCGICHGDKCAGNGYLVSEDNPNAKYPAQPANLLLDTFANGNNGRLYHAIMYGKNVMGNYADKLSYEERWQVIHYIRSCQADGAKLQYDEEKNLFRPQAAIAGAMATSMAANKKMVPLAPIKMKAVKMTTPATVPDPAVGGGDGGHMKRR